MPRVLRRLPPPTTVLATVLAAVLAAFVLPAAGCNAQGSDTAFGARVRTYLLAHPEVLQEALETLQTRREAQKVAAAGAVIAARRQALEHDPRDAVLGDPAAPITVVEFFDYRCPFCKAAAADLRKLLADNTDVRLVLKDFPILDLEDRSRISEDASRMALGARAQGRFAAVHQALLAQSHLDEDAIHRVLSEAGVDMTRDQAVAKSQAVTDQLADTLSLAHAIGVDGTPGFVIGDQLIAGARMDALDAAIKSQRAALAKAR